MSPDGVLEVDLPQPLAQLANVTPGGLNRYRTRPEGGSKRRGNPPVWRAAAGKASAWPVPRARASPRPDGVRAAIHMASDPKRQRHLCVRRYSGSMREEWSCTTTDLLEASLWLVGASLEAGFTSGRVRGMTPRPPGRP